MGLAPIYQRPRTTVPNPEHRIWPYLLRTMEIDRPNQVWCADITYIPMRRGFLYLVAVMDWASRKVLSWRLSNTMDVEFCIEALEEALTRLGRPEIFNTDQGGQFTSAAVHRGVDREAGVQDSMDGRAGGWTTSSSSGCGDRSNMNASTERLRDRRGARAGLEGGSTTTMPSDPIRRSSDGPRTRPTGLPARQDWRRGETWAKLIQAAKLSGRRGPPHTGGPVRRMSAVSAASSSGVVGRLRCVDWCWPKTRQASRSGTPSLATT